ncbi:MAG: hypothetical protein ABI811_22980 [Acidobacteriota bacterium]
MTEKKKRLALRRDVCAIGEGISLEGGTWPFDDELLGPLERKQYLRDYGKKWRADREAAKSGAASRSIL